MDEAHNKLLERLRTYYGDDLACRTLLMDARHALEALAGDRDRTRADYETMKAHNKELFGKLSAAELERDRLAGEVERLTTNGVHTCHDQCQRPLCKSYREIVAAKKHGKLLNKMLGEAEAERDRLKAALEDAKEMVISWGSYAPTYFAEKHDLLGDVERLNKALGDAS